MIQKRRMVPFGLILVIPADSQPTEVEQSLRPDATGVTPNTETIPTAQYMYQSIRPLKGKYANDPSWEALPGFLEEYDRQMNELYEE